MNIMEKFNEQKEANIENIQQESLNNLLKDIKTYDEQHDFSSWLSQDIINKIIDKSETKYEKSDIQNFAINKNEDKRITIKDIYKKDSIMLNKLGINVKSSKKEDLEFKDGKSMVGELVINLTNKNLYIDFLKGLDARQLTKETEELLKILSNKFTKQIRQEYSLDKADDDFLELVSGLKDIIAEYDRLGLSQEIIELKEYQKYMNTGYLKEYISAKNHHIFEPVGKEFNLSTFQRDASYTYYKEYWDENFFKELENIEKNEKAKDLYNEVLKYGKDCIAFAEKDIEKIKDIRGNQYIENIKRAIADVKGKIKAFE
jgi:hypothetical protein